MKVRILNVKGFQGTALADSSALSIDLHGIATRSKENLLCRAVFLRKGRDSERLRWIAAELALL
ncbi:hypothetical protein K227x_44420 [Rubripirellula lacrimiformis]|uniref:Uncharacterized protein n=1 Tax=Rubripirellula lacrimiformis TaxID=1930273 RepID=A0A517NFX7_9BACT|nr:hypothetical protein K227x_44420 [Rubripirellula lacrimiformis]